jgi:RHS repeat-associated protein
MSGNCRAYVNADGMTVTDTITYRAFGEEIAGNAPNAKQSHYGAQSGYYHNTAGTSGVGAGRLYVRANWMDPTKSVWLSQDPIGLDTDDWNLYRYVGNRPVIVVDPSGMAACKKKPKPPGPCIGGPNAGTVCDPSSCNDAMRGQCKESAARCGEIWEACNGVAFQGPCENEPGSTTACQDACDEVVKCWNKSLG